MLLFGRLVNLLLLVKVSLNLLLLHERLRGVLLLQVVEHRAGHLLAQLHEALARHAQLTHAVDLELLHLAVHVGEERREVLGDLLVADQMLCILTSVELTDELAASRINLLDSVREPFIVRPFLDVSDGTECRNLTLDPLRIILCLALLQVKLSGRLQLSDTRKVVWTLAIGSRLLEGT